MAIIHTHHIPPDLWPSVWCHAGSDDDVLASMMTCRTLWNLGLKVHVFSLHHLKRCFSKAFLTTLFRSNLKYDFECLLGQVTGNELSIKVLDVLLCTQNFDISLLFALLKRSSESDNVDVFARLSQESCFTAFHFAHVVHDICHDVCHGKRSNRSPYYLQILKLCFQDPRLTPYYYDVSWYPWEAFVSYYKLRRYLLSILPFRALLFRDRPYEQLYEKALMCNSIAILKQLPLDHHPAVAQYEYLNTLLRMSLMTHVEPKACRLIAQHPQWDPSFQDWSVFRQAYSLSEAYFRRHGIGYKYKVGIVKYNAIKASISQRGIRMRLRMHVYILKHKLNNQIERAIGNLDIHLDSTVQYYLGVGLSAQTRAKIIMCGYIAINFFIAYCLEWMYPTDWQSFLYHQRIAE